MLLVRHDGPLKGSERAAHHHCSVCQEGGTEDTAVGRRGDAGECGEVFTGLHQAYGRPLVTVTSFKYLGRVLAAADDDWPEVVGNLRKVRKSWSQMARILGQEGASPRVSGMFFKAVVQVVLLFKLETWVLTPRMGRALGSFQHRVARQIMGRQPK